ncbi:hypothetical protein [Nonomuraea jiangxiensis]|uniref:hypothetical protein n=1 Tax=Nonomuraea jiangxiensis TaxID=633440 RepID=UPI00115FF90F|nr:hypothetical protein [Nonomuraea jiangxiensis]
MIQHNGAVGMPGDRVDGGLGQEHAADPGAEGLGQVGRVRQDQPGGGLSGGHPDARLLQLLAGELEAGLGGGHGGCRRGGGFGLGLTRLVGLLAEPVALGMEALPLGG